MKIKTKMIIEIILIATLSYGFIANTLHFVAVRKTYNIKFNTFFKVDEFQDKIKDLKTRLKKIDSSNDQVKTIINDLNTYIKLEEKSFIYAYEGHKNFSDIDKFKMLYQEHKFSKLFDALIIMGDLDKNIEPSIESYRYNLMASSVATNPIFVTLINNYNFHTNDLLSGNIIKNNDSTDFQVIRDQVYSYLYTADYIVLLLEKYTGGNNE